MPELPEVETIARILRSGSGSQPAITDLQIHRAVLLWERTLAEPSAVQFCERIRGQAITGVRRRGKFLILQLSRDRLLIHLRMSGDLVVDRQDSEPSPHQRISLDLDRGLRLSFVDPRKFGRVWLVEDEQKVLAGLGPEPLDESFTAPVLFSMLHARRRQLKPLLLDQTFVAGLGNIYTDEALHLAKLHPLQLSDQLALSHAHNLLDSIRLVLLEGIRRNGASIDWVYRGGDFQNYFRVYQRTGEACPVCGAAIQRMVVGQRGTHFCPVCQPAPMDSRS
jgi:formamidopyrimidine-DNA glycosylase